ncbi:MAG: hypothetical protein ACE5HO_08975, partial [bacterium]
MNKMASYFCLALMAMSCSGRQENVATGKVGATELTVKQAIEKHKDELLSLPGVVGIAEGRCDRQPCIAVLVQKKTAELQNQIPDQLEGYPVTIKESGEFGAL